VPNSFDDEYYPTYSPVTTPHAPAGKNRIGLNLGNTLDAVPTEGTWTAGVGAQERYFDDYAAAGFNFVRVPITWGSHVGTEAPYTIDPVFLDRVAQVVQWGLDRKLTIVINCHHEGWVFREYDKQIGRLDAIWKQIAERFQHASDNLIFEIINEPYGDITDAQVNDLNQRELNIIRATNPTRTVLVGPNNYNQFTKLPAMNLPLTNGKVDTHLMANFHYYSPWDFAGKALGTWGTPEDIATMKADFATVKQWSASHGNIPIFLGEYGAIQQNQGLITEIQSRLLWYKTASELARANGFWYAAWDDFGGFGIFGRSDDTMEDHLLEVIFGK